MEKCAFSRYGPCRGKISREHYISRGVLDYIGKGLHPVVGGFPFIKDGTLSVVGANSLTAKFLCRYHNSILSHFDAVAKSLVETIDTTDKDPHNVPDEIEFVGADVEKWLLKVVVGMTFGPMKSRQLLADSSVAKLFEDHWPEGWGLYLDTPRQPTISATGVEVVFRKNPETNEILGVSFDVCGVVCHLLLGKPDNPESFGLYRPRGIITKLPHGLGEKRIGFTWAASTNTALIRTRVGTTTKSPFDRWTAT